jgi:hypothetical protein
MFPSLGLLNPCPKVFYALFEVYYDPVLLFVTPLSSVKPLAAFLSYSLLLCPTFVTPLSDGFLPFSLCLLCPCPIFGCVLVQLFCCTHVLLFAAPLFCLLRPFPIFNYAPFLFFVALMSNCFVGPLCYSLLRPCLTVCYAPVSLGSHPRPDTRKLVSPHADPVPLLIHSFAFAPYTPFSPTSITPLFLHTPLPLLHTPLFPPPP